MITLMALSILCLAGIAVLFVVGGVALLVVGLPVLLLLNLLPWLLNIAGVILLIKALLDRPIRWESFTPAAIAFALALVAGWIF